MSAADDGFELLSTWQYASSLTPDELPPMLRERFFAKDGTVAIYAFPAKSVYKPENLDELLDEVYRVSPLATGFPTTHQVFSRMVVDSFRKGTLLAVILAVLWILLVLRSVSAALIALLPLVVGGGWMMGLMYMLGMDFTYANIIALPLVIGLAVDYGVWFAHRRRELADLSAWQVAVIAGRAILLAAGTTLAGLGAIAFAQYRGVSSMGISITIGLCCCVFAALLVSPALTVLLFGRKK
jgi:predicted RND superfamily exporter protein